MRKLLTLSAFLVLLDQGTKMAVKGFNLFGIHHEGMERGQSIPVIGDFIRFTFVENPGMAFGLDFGMPLLLGLFSIGAAIFLVYLLRKARDTKVGGFHYALSMILAGAVGNLIDRVFYGVFYGYAPLFKGKVVDFIDVDLPDNLFGLNLDRFYVFNIADSAVSVGIVLLLIFYPKYERMVQERKAEEKRTKVGEAEENDMELDGEVDYDEGVDTTAHDMLIHQTGFHQSSSELGNQDREDDNKSAKDGGDHKSHGRGQDHGKDDAKSSSTNDDSKPHSPSGHHSGHGGSRSHDSDSTSSSGGGWWSNLGFGSSDSSSNDSGSSDSGSSDSGGWSDSGGSDSSSFD